MIVTDGRTDTTVTQHGNTYDINTSTVSGNTGFNSFSKFNTKLNVVEGVEKRESSYSIGGNANWYNHYGEQYEGALKN